MDRPNIGGGNLAGGNPSRGRVENDYYATPSSATELFLETFNQDLGSMVWEPACGEGHISKVLMEKYPNSKVLSTDLVNRGYGEQLDFLDCENIKVDTVITNPPFKFAQEFIEKGLEVASKYVIMFAKIQFLEGKSRKEFFAKNQPKYVYVHSSRVNPLRNGSEVDENGKKWSSTMCFAWFVFEKNYNGETIVRWL